MTESKDGYRDVVKRIFEGSKKTPDKVSALFNHLRPSSKSSSTKNNLPSSYKLLPAAIDIGTSSIKLLQLAKGAGGEIKIVALDKEVYPAPVRPDSISHQRQALKQIFERNKVGDSIVTSLFVKDIQTYNLVFPQMSESELLEALRWKIAQLRPFGLDIEGIKYDFIKLDSYLGAGGKSTQQRVIVVCSPHDVIQQRLTLLQAFGLKVEAIEVSPLSLVNLRRFRKFEPLKDEVVIWLDLGADESSLVVEIAGVVCFLRKLILTSAQLTKQIAQHCRMKDNEAEIAKKEIGLSFWSPDKRTSALLEKEEKSEKDKNKTSQIFYSIISSLENLVVDIEHSFKYFSYQVSQSQIAKFDRVIISGGGANLKNLDRFLSARLGVPVEKLNPFESLEVINNIRKEKKDLINTSSDYAVVTGLAVKSLIKKPRTINLLSEKKTRAIGLSWTNLKEKPIVKVSLIAGLIISLLGFQIGKVMTHKRRMDAASKQIEITKKQLSRLQATQLTLSEAEGKLLEGKAVIQARLDLLKKAVRDPQEFAQVLVDVASLLPEEIWVTKLSYSEKKLVLTGLTSNSQLIVDLIESFKESKYFVDASFGYTQKDPKEDIYDFEIIAEIKQSINLSGTELLGGYDR
jgi:type IV pilus assembly protein PilM